MHRVSLDDFQRQGVEVSMHAGMLETRRDMVMKWRSSADADSPAGPLYAAGAFAEADIAAPDMITTVARYTHGCSACTSSNGHPCC
jgi:Family of unknown function (DUF6229)